jgi:hypothetical protein
VPTYVVESYAAVGGVGSQRERARLAARPGSGVGYVRTTFLPGDETVLHVFDAASVEALRRAIQDAALPYDRIVEAVEASAGETPT